MYKRDFVNLVFVASFSIYGIGSYIVVTNSPSIGYVISSSAYLVLIVFYFLDLLYGGRVRVRLGGLSVYMLLFTLSCAASLFVALYRGLPDTTFFSSFGRSLLVLVPFPAFLVVYAYNDRSPADHIPKLIFRALTIYLIVNLFGYYGLGLTNQGHSLEGRVNLPFFGGLYSAASMLVIINLMIVHRMRKVWWTNPIHMSGYTLYFALNCFFLYQINSRLSLMIFAGMLLLIFFGGIRSSAVYWTSIFMLPLLLNLSLLVYQILTLPVFESIMQRVDFENVTTFSGRSFVWERGLDWVVDDQRGFVFGNGYQGQYFLGTLWEIGMLWNPKNPGKMHFHSTSLEVFVNQGLVGIGLLLIIAYKLFVRYREKYAKREPDGVFFLALVYLLFDLQVSSFVYLDGLGGIILALLVAGVTLRKKVDEPLKVEDKVEMATVQ